MKRTTRFPWTAPGLVLLTVLSACSLVSLSSSALEPPGSDPQFAFAERALRKAGVTPDGPGLLAFIRGRTLSEARRQELANKVRSLGSAEFEEREKATRELIELGRAALPYLRPAIEDADLERSRRARRCIEQIQRQPNPSLLALAGLLVKARRPAGAVDVLLAYLPNVEDDALEQTWLDALRAVGWSEGRPDPALFAALTDKRSVYRAAAAHVLGRGADAAVRRRGPAPLLADADARVRFEAAAALARFDENKAVAVLLALLDDGPFSLACQAEYLLRLLAEGSGPEASLDKDETALRRQSRAAWQAWWNKHADRVDLTRLQSEEPLHGLTLVCEDVDGGKVWEWAGSGQPSWEILGLEGPNEVQLLPGGRLLIAEHHANRVTERDCLGKVHWEHQTEVNPIACQRLPNGNTLIATYEELYEVTRAGKKVFHHNDRRDFRDARRLPNGRLLYVTSTGVLVERDAACEHLLRTIEPEDFADGVRYRARVEPLLNGRYLLTLGGADRVVEIDAAGKIRWQYTIKHPMSAARLRNGHTLIACFDDRCLLEVDRAGKEVNKQVLKGHPFAARRY